MGSTTNRVAWLVGAAVVALGVALWLADGTPSKPSVWPDPSERTRTSPTTRPGLAGSGSVQSPAKQAVTALAARASRAVVRDLGTGDPVPGLLFYVRTQGGSARAAVASDASGELSLDSDVAAVVPDGSEWRLVDAGLDAGVIWVARRVRLHGIVRAEGPPGATIDLTTVRVVLQEVGAPSAATGHASPDPWNFEWLRRHGLGVPRAAEDPGAGGSFSFEVLRTKYLGLRASAPGWGSELVEVQPGEGTEMRPVRVVLRPQPSVRGVVQDAEGRPVAGARVRLQVLMQVPAADLDPQRAVDNRYATSIIAGPDGIARLTYASAGETDPKGKFDLDAPTEGDSLLVLHAPGFLPRRIPSPQRADANRFILERARGAGIVRLRIGDRRLATRGLTVSDITDIDRQITFGLAIDEGGAAPAEWFEAGRDYILNAGGGVHAYVHWDSGLRELDLQAYPSTLEAFRASRR